jgi:hypothetical protein
MNNLNKVVKGFQNNAGVRIPINLPKPTYMGGGAGGAGKPSQAKIPGLENLKTKPEIQESRLKLAQENINKHRAKLDEHNASKREAKKNNDKTAEQKAKEKSAYERTKWQNAKRILKQVEKGF